MATLDKFKEVLKPIINAEVTEKTAMRSLHLCPVDLVTLVSDLEDAFEIQIDDEAAENRIKTVGDWIMYIDRCVGNKEKTGVCG
jgi:acyl carrier protein